MTDVTEHYEDIAGEYDDLWTYSDAYLEAMTDEIIRHLDIRPHHRVVDLGGGTGLYARRIRNRIRPTYPILVVDPSSAMLESLHDRDGLESVNADARQFSASGRRYDRLLLKEVVHHFDDLDGTLELLVEGLERDGRMLVVMLPPTIDYPLFDAALRRYEELQPHFDEVRYPLEAAGLTVTTDFVTLPITVATSRYLAMVAGRYMSVLHEFDEAELERGLDEMRSRLTSAEVTIPDTFVFLSARRTT